MSRTQRRPGGIVTITETAWLPITPLTNTGHLKELAWLDMKLVVDRGEPLLQLLGRDYTRGQLISKALDNHAGVSQVITSKVKSFMA